MKCENDKEQLIDYLNNQLPGKERVALENHLAHCQECQAELVINQQLWNLMGEIPRPTPSANMPVKFKAMLDTYKESVEERNNFWSSFLEKIQQLWAFQPRLQMAYGIGLLFIGLGLGYFLNHQTSDRQEKIEVLSAEVQEMKQMVMLSLLENPSASERIRAVSYTEEMKEVDKQVIDALFTTLNNDSNDNVRLMTLEALANLAHYPSVREGLVQSITQQESPLVQSAMADVMVKLQEKRAVKSFKKLLQQKDLNGLVKGKIEKSITEII